MTAQVFLKILLKPLENRILNLDQNYQKIMQDLGLGTFLGKTLLERQSAVISFENGSSLNGAKVKIKWSINDLANLSC